MDEMRAEYEAMKLVPKTTLNEMLSNPALRAPMIIAVMMMLAQQLSGINAVTSRKTYSLLVLVSGELKL
jgi:SP family facilitated glucose transporter-like MFS transporter 1